jgi:hypothetical protein
MFAVLYQGYVKEGRAEEYKKFWHKIASYFLEHRGAIGSCLHQTDDGLWIAYSRWPDKATRDASWHAENAPESNLPEEIKAAIKILKDCLDPQRKFSEICMEVVDDLLIKNKGMQKI